ncbi:hypothetical protein LOZ39_006544 [Ophidiomyces ophidiicola]|nr:hypothetical protein LOZ49_006325 [Ophidiomyces ophidiicola]KAI2066023.1 hypothetical protein LOZ39_006544 [Ophidiomyces ophidiicola]KAI2129504.1 hypothetical protein LOZ28_006647 [Ophidiomyces ophidiicola]KAI2208564.1 hypothetical protein LOZ15_006579 [Ophidiomyces ophidiicola]KAI2434872.1 hypothetical protein LOZ08_006540 [Ophidiomyces ophidiicola]
MLDSVLNDLSLVARSGGLSTNPNSRPPAFKAVGISLAVASGLFIGVSFVLKKFGLLKANVKYNEEAGEGYGYLKNFYWWAGMILMVLGEVCNFVAYAFVDAILVTPLGALSVVVTTILSAIFLKERLSFVGKVGCFNCIIGSVVIALNAPQQSSVTNIQDMKGYVIRPVFLTYAGVLIVGCTFLALWAGPRYGKKSMFVYLFICSLIGALSVVATQGLGAAIIAQISGQSQFKEWFLYVLLVFVILTLLTEIIYLNKALNIFNAALVTPTYYVIFTSATIVTSAILFKGFKGSPISITTVVMGFLQICAGVVLLQLSKSAKDVPDAAIFKGDLDQVREVAEQEQPETEPKADAIRGTAAIIRRISTPRQKMERDELLRYHNERRLEKSDVPGDNEIVEWDGLRRRKTLLSPGSPSTAQFQKTLHPPLGMSRFPDYDEELISSRPRTGRSFLSSFRSRASSGRRVSDVSQGQGAGAGVELRAVAGGGPAGNNNNNNNNNNNSQKHSEATAASGLGSSLAEPFQYHHHHQQRRSRRETAGSVRFADDLKLDDNGRNSISSSSNSSPPTPPVHASSHRQFSFQRLLYRDRDRDRTVSSSETAAITTTGSGDRSPRREQQHGILRLPGFATHRPPAPSPSPVVRVRDATEEEVLGLVRGDTAETHASSGLTPSPASSIIIAAAGGKPTAKKRFGGADDDDDDGDGGGGGGPAHVRQYYYSEPTAAAADGSSVTSSTAADSAVKKKNRDLPPLPPEHHQHAPLPGSSADGGGGGGGRGRENRMQQGGSGERPGFI